MSSKDRSGNPGMAGEDPHRYDDMLSLPHPDPKHHMRMPRAKRATQFAPFAFHTEKRDAENHSSE